MGRVKLVWSDVYLYTISNVNVHTPASAGVYRLSYRRDNKRPVFYVGQAETLDRRLRDHLSDEESIELAELSGADYVILGKAVASSGGNVPESNMRSCFANITIKVIQVEGAR